MKGELAIKTSGPFEIVRVHVNSIIIIQLQIGVTERIKIPHTIPYQDPLV